MLRLSIVIPVLGDQSLLDDTLVSVLENRPSNCEILVVHNRPYSDPYELAGEVQFVEAPRRAGFADCVNLGVEASRSPVVHILCCGVEVRPGWANAAIRHFRDPEVGCVTPLVVRRDDNGSVVSAGLGYRAEGVAWQLGRGRTPDQVTEEPEDLCGPDGLAGFYRRSALESVGGFVPSTMKTLTAIDMALSLQKAGYRCIVEPSAVAQVDLAAVREKNGFRYGLGAERLFWRWASAHGRVRSVAAHAALLAGECVIGLWRPSLLMQMAGRGFGVLAAALSRSGHRPAVSHVEDPVILQAAQFSGDEPSSSRAA